MRIYILLQGIWFFLSNKKVNKKVFFPHLISCIYQWISCMIKNYVDMAFTGLLFEADVTGKMAPDINKVHWRLILGKQTLRKRSQQNK